MTLYKSFKKSFGKKGKYYRINYYITAPTVRLIDSEGKQIGIFSRNEALRRAKEANVDLVEIAPLAKPPVCKLIDFKKFKYLENKKEKEVKKKTKNIEIKQIILSPFIGEHDFKIKQEKAWKFLKSGHHLKLAVQFKGRQLGKKEFGWEIINKMINVLSETATVERPPHQEGQTIVAQLIPTKKKEIKNEKTQNEKSNSETI